MESHDKLKIIVIILFQEMALIMSRIRVVRIWTMNELIELCQNIKQKIIEFDNIALMIVDSLPCLMLQFLGDENKIGMKMMIESNILVCYISKYLGKIISMWYLCFRFKTIKYFC